MKTKRLMILALMVSMGLASNFASAQATTKPALTDAPPASGSTTESAEKGEKDDKNAKDEKKVGEESKNPSKGPFDSMLIWIMLGAFMLMWFWMGRSKRKQAAKRKEMLSALKKGDKVTSIGGLIGNVVEIREGEVIVKIDDIRMRFARWAIRGVGEQAKEENPDEKK